MIVKVKVEFSVIFRANNYFVKESQNSLLTLEDAQTLLVPFILLHYYTSAAFNWCESTWTDTVQNMGIYTNNNAVGLLNL